MKWAIIVSDNTEDCFLPKDVGRTGDCDRELLQAATRILVGKHMLQSKDESSIDVTTALTTEVQ